MIQRRFKNYFSLICILGLIGAAGFFPEAKAAAGITEGLIRIAVGLEDVADIQKDCERGLAALS